MMRKPFHSLFTHPLLSRVRGDRVTQRVRYSNLAKEIHSSVSHRSFLSGHERGKPRGWPWGETKIVHIKRSVVQAARKIKNPPVIPSFCSGIPI